MENDLISRETLMREIQGRCDTLKTAGILGAEHVLKHHALELIEAAPAVEAEPVVHARWIPTKDSTGFTRNTCSNCGRIVDTFTAISAPYCHCGARMDADAPERAGKE